MYDFKTPTQFCLSVCFRRSPCFMLWRILLGISGSENAMSGEHILENCRRFLEHCLAGQQTACDVDHFLVTYGNEMISIFTFIHLFVYLLVIFTNNRLKRFQISPLLLIYILETVMYILHSISFFFSYKH